MCQRYKKYAKGNKLSPEENKNLCGLEKCFFLNPLFSSSVIRCMLYHIQHQVHCQNLKENAECKKPVPI